ATKHISRNQPVEQLALVCRLLVQRRCFMARVLVVEDERKVLRGLRAGLEHEGYEVVTTDNGDEACRLALAQPFDCLVLDLMLPGRDGLEVLTELRRA